MTNAISPVRRRGRPPKAVGDFRETREALCRAGLAALTQKGFSATGIDEILKTAGVPKGSFYNFFPSKEAFGAELIRLYAQYFARKLDRHFLDESLTPLERLKAFCADAEASMARYAFHRGCLIGNLGQEMEALPEAYRAQLTDVLLDWQARTARCIDAARAAGEISPRIDGAQWAAFFWIGWEGAVLRAKLERSAKPLQIYTDLFVMSLKA
ncbi:MAG: TetR family transcriptional regulator [Azoarcus sp. PHD]|nr:MAG: TetR family transcriptional regulator [Azoarcus sp. PHD]